MASSTAAPDILQSLDESDDVTTWINDTLSPDDASLDGESDLATLDHQLTSLVATLDIACEDTAAHLERVIDEVSRGVPRLTYDIHFMKDSATTLQLVVAKVSDKALNSFPPTTNDALDRLQVLDTIKGHMEAAREVLREAESWSSLEMEVTSLLGEQSYEKAAERLSEANKSMVVFQNTPEYESRRVLMVSLQNQLEACLSSALVAAINTQDVSVCRKYFTIFTNIQRESEFRNYYNGSRRSPLVESWQSTLSSSDAETTSHPNFVEFLRTFYDSFTTLLDAERISMPSIFPDPQVSLSSLIVSVLSSLQPSYSQQLSSLFERNGASALKELIATLKQTEGFAGNVGKIMEKLKFAASLSAPSPTAEGSENPLGRAPSHRRRSSRMSISWRGGMQRTISGAIGGSGKNAPVIDDNLDWDRELFQPFLDFQADYGSLERRFLQDSLQDILHRVSSQQKAGSDKARFLREATVDVFGLADEAMARCAAFTHGYGAVGLVQSLDHLFQTFIESWQTEADEKQVSSSSTHQPLSSADLADMDYTAQDWANLQQYLHLLAASRAIFDRLVAFESKLRSTLQQIASQFRLAEEDAHTFSIAPVKGEDLLLQQTTLNSAELHALLSGLSQRDVPPGDFQRAHAQPSQADASVSTPPLAAARTAVYAFAKSCQLSMQDTILSPLRRHLASYASSSLWMDARDPKSRTVTAGMSDLQVPSFSLSPSDSIQKVSEGLLNMPRLFEVYADDDALAFSLHTLPYVGEEVLKTIAEHHSTSFEGGSSRHMRRASLVPMQPVAPTLDPEAVTSTWLASLGHSLLNHIMTEILPGITTLTLAGAAQLSSDLSYLSTIMSALNVGSDDFEKWKEYVDASPEDGKRLLAERPKDDYVLRTVARMRGW
ncbi:hypothetical protein HGRIS_002537 [Hohenbuehelia grisea]|uniref:Conserved oligomeric Golgi complex subunit 7 n=1 Tax=Hohenbuehelia grisea TaxID=104357 RepID=A0ABR3JKR9_9AGAR